MKLRNKFALANIALVAIVQFAISGCTEKVEEAGPQEEELPNIKVELPAKPDFDEARAPVKWEDDADQPYSIYGLRKDIDDRLKEGEDGKEVVVKGWVQEITFRPSVPRVSCVRPASSRTFGSPTPRTGKARSGR